MDKLDKHATKTSCSAFCSQLKAGSFNKDALVFWMEQVTHELTKETEEEKEPGENPGDATSFPKPD